MVRVDALVAIAVMTGNDYRRPWPPRVRAVRQQIGELSFAGPNR